MNVNIKLTSVMQMSEDGEKKSGLNRAVGELHNYVFPTNQANLLNDKTIKKYYHSAVNSAQYMKYRLAKVQKRRRSKKQ